MIDRVSLTTILVGRAGEPFPSGQVFTAEVMRELAESRPDRFQFDERTGELTRTVNLVYEGNTIFIC